jgi:hypothetical protein
MLATMPRYMVVRTFSVHADEMPTVGRRSRVLTETEFPTIIWEHSHIAVDADGVVKSFCVYEAPSEEIVREHAMALGQHTVDVIYEIAGDVTPADFPG